MKSSRPRRPRGRFSSLLLALPLWGGGQALAAANGADNVDSTQDESDVVITANRREEKLSTATSSVSAYTAKDMEKINVKSFADLAPYTPGVTYDYLTKNIAIRGLVSTAGAGATGIYVDDTPIQMRALYFSPNNSQPSVFDLDRVEVLRGPQGTLFGAGAEGGAVRYITTQPSLTHFSALGRAEFSVTERGAPSQEVGAAIGGPIIEDQLGFRLSANRRHEGGWIDLVDSNGGALTNRNANSADINSVRGALTWKPTPRLSITPALYYSERDQHFGDVYWVALSDPGAGRFVSGGPDPMADKDRFYLPSLTVRYDFDRMSFISNTSFYERKERVNGYSGTIYDLSYFQQLLDPGQPGGPIDPAGTPCGVGCRSDLFPLLTPAGFNLPGFEQFRSQSTIVNKQSNYTQEFRLQSRDADARLNWLVGLFFADNREHSHDAAIDPFLPDFAQYLFGETMSDIWGIDLGSDSIEYTNDTIAHDRQLALFADAAYALTNKLKITGGLRVADTQFEFGNYADGPLNFGLSTGEGKQEEHPVTPRLGLSYQIDADNLIYGSVAKGYRVGGANPPLPASICQTSLDEMKISSVPSSYQSDTVMNYEIGMRDKLLDRRLSTSFSVFHADWNNIQQQNYLSSCGLYYTANLGAATTDGFEFSADLKATSAFSADIAIGYTDARYSKTLRTSSAADAPVLAAKGDTLGGSRWIAALGGQYDFRLADNPAFVRADYTYNGGNPRVTRERDPATTSYDPFLVAEPQVHIVSARTGATFGRTDVALFVDNLFDAHPQLDLHHEDQYTLLLEATTLRPRTAGVTLSYRY